MPAITSHLAASRAYFTVRFFGIAGLAFHIEDVVGRRYFPLLCWDRQLR
jgi:hypothetical protein